MSLTIAGRSVGSVKIVDDDKNAREGLSFSVEDAELHPICEDGPLPPLKDFVAKTVKEVDAVLCDHHLKLGRYAGFDGTEVVSYFYQRRFPVVLCTSWSKADIDAMRLHRRFIPVLIRTDEVSPESIVKGFEVCIEEFKGNYLPSRREVQTLVRIEDTDIEQNPNIVYAVVPGWNPRQVVRFPITVIDKSLWQHVKAGERFFAKVNIGAENQADLFFVDFDYRGK